VFYVIVGCSTGVEAEHSERHQSPTVCCPDLNMALKKRERVQAFCNKRNQLKIAFVKGLRREMLMELVEKSQGKN
jgi:hypothetical protein